MPKFNVKIRVRYAETDKMGFVYYGNYATYFEVARVEYLRSLGILYKKWEDDGIILPVRNFSIKYKKPAYYDDLLTIEVEILEKPSLSVKFGFKTLNENKELLNTAFVELVFLNKKTNKPFKAPQSFIEKTNF